MRRQWMTPLAVATVLTLGMTGCSLTASTSPATDSPTTTAHTGDLDRFYSQTVNWKACDDGFQCATISVPLSYDDPNGQTIALNINRHKARDSAHGLGPLLVNPGGPGGSGLDFARSYDAFLSPSVSDRFDVVGFDPRGVGTSTPLQCLTAAQTDNFVSTMGTPWSAEETKAVTDTAHGLGQGCKERSATLVANVGTVPAAKDMDIIRGVLGVKKISYLGKSYGTFLGLTFINLFPNSVDRFVLDGVIAPDLTNDELAQGQSDGFQLALSRFVANCPKHGNCPLPDGQAAGMKRISDFLTSLQTKPLSTDTSRPLTRAMAFNAIVGSLYEQRSGWPMLRDALSSAFSGDGSDLEEIVDSFTGRNEDGTYSSNSIDALYGVNCLDRPDRANVARTEELATQWKASAPLFGPDLAWGNLPCYDWPAPATDAAKKMTGEGAPPVMLVGTVNDPATPYRWATQTAAQMPTAALVSWNGDGHTAYMRGSDCVDQAVDKFYFEGTTPGARVNCGMGN